MKDEKVIVATIDNGQNEKQAAEKKKLDALKKAAAPKTEQEKEMEAIQAEIEAKQRDLQKCLDDLTRKKRLSDNRDVFVNTLLQLDHLSEAIKDKSDDFESPVCYIKVMAKNSYRDEQALSISCTSVVLEVINLITEKIEVKKQEIESELMK